MGYKIGIVIADPHLEYVDKPAYACAMRGIQIIKPDIFINLGDTGDFPAASHHKWKKKRRPDLNYQLPEVDADIALVNRRLDLIDSVLDDAGCKTKHMIQGNHDEWLDRLVEENAHLATTKHKYGLGYLYKDAVSVATRGYKFTPVQKRLKIGKLYFYHGHLIGGIDHPRQHLLRWGVNIMYGDKHDVQQRSVTHIDGEKSAWCMGCLKRMDHDANNFVRGRPTNWGHAFAIVYFMPNGNFHVQVVRIVDGQCIVNGEVVDGKKLIKTGTVPME
jgi:hypothetical protein